MDEKKQRGRKVTVDVRNNPTYFKDYYYKFNTLMQCECGVWHKRQSKTKHLNCKKHREIMEILAKTNNPEIKE